MKIYNCMYCNSENIITRQKSNKYCNNKCMQNFLYEEYIERWKNGSETGVKGLTQTSNYIRRYVEKKFNSKCQGCGISSVYNGKPLTLQLEHLDGDSRNNKEENLSLLCPNCHTQTPFYGSKNRGRGRGSLIKMRD